MKGTDFQVEETDYVPGDHHAQYSQHEMPEYVPIILAQMQDDLARSRMREAFWISMIVHILAVLFLAFSPKLLPNFEPVHIITARDLTKDKDLTYLELPPDAQKVTQRPNTHTLSDKDRVATSRTPQIDKKTLQELKNAQRAGSPGAPPMPAQRPMQAQAPQPQQAPQQANNAGQQQQTAPPQQAKDNPLMAMNTPPQRVQPQQPKQNPFSASLSAGSAIQQAARASARSGSVGSGGDFGIGPPDRNARMGNIDILSDTQGVDFGPYLSRVVQAVRENWYNLIPEEARAPLLKRGKVAIRFLIMPNGKVAGLAIESPSGDIPLDRAAFGGITASDPFSPLPSNFKGPYLALRFKFFYNPNRADME